ncbi:hypothetical protein [Spiroplasma endosymbiont of Ammophila pubescens]|uniref:hypothetical protein n=1 Tax=Spiroplasma endosymbiont of Ammophila pubescens TaxID=3066315 RepID=UPI0032B24148
MDITKIHSLIFELQNQNLEQQESIFEEKNTIKEITALKGCKKRIKSSIKKTNNKDTILKETDSLLVWATNTLHELMIDFLMETNSEYEFYESRVDIWNYLNKEKDEINIYEIKTATKENYFSQIAKAIGQLFYYRYYYPEFKNVKKINLIISCNQTIKDESLEQMFNDLANNNNIIIVLNSLNIKDYVLERDDFKNLDEINKNAPLKML